jgi:1,2-diacylglycerol 3-beta-galactosyltransferase
VIEKQVGVVIRSFANVVPAVRSLMEPGRLSELRRNVKAQNNRAVFEIPEFLSSLLREKKDSSAELPVEVKVGN